MDRLITGQVMSDQVYVLSCQVMSIKDKVG